MKAYVRAGEVEHALIAPLGAALNAICTHLGGRSRATFDRIAKLDRERAPGEHRFDRLELLELIVAAHGLLCDPPIPIRKLRRIAVGPLPAATQVAELRDWLAGCAHPEVIYDLWKSAQPVVA